VQNSSLQLKTLILSDIHLGTKYCKAKEVLNFLRRCHFEKLILNGDIIDGWSLKRQGGWSESHSQVLNLIIQYIEDPTIEVIFLKGNHDEMLDEVLDFPIDKLNMIREHIHENIHGNWRGKPYFSISKVAKAKVKSIVGSSDNLESKLMDAAIKADCVGIICGHIHTAIDQKIGDIHYLNSGDWVESLTAIAEYPEGHFEIINYQNFT